MFVTISQAKDHLNIDKNFNSDDDYILHLIRSAEDAIAKRLNVKSITYLIDRKTGGLPDSIIHSILLLIGDWYASRETFAFQNIGKLPYSFDFLCNLNRNYQEPF